LGGSRIYRIKRGSSKRHPKAGVSGGEGRNSPWKQDCSVYVVPNMLSELFAKFQTERKPSRKTNPETRSIKASQIFRNEMECISAVTQEKNGRFPCW
jgi:hypothetical protein